MPDRTDRIQSQSFNAYWKRTKRSLAAHLDLTGSGNRLAEGYIQLTFLSCAGDIPGDNVTVLNVKYFSRAAQQNAKGFQFTLKDLVVDLVILT